MEGISDHLKENLDILFVGFNQAFVQERLVIIMRIQTIAFGKSSSSRADTKEI